jgi:hypothetical protein
MFVSDIFLYFGPYFEHYSRFVLLVHGFKFTFNSFLQFLTNLT